MKLLLPFLLLFPIFSFSQKITILDSSQKISIRGLSVVSDKVLWVSGNKGMVGKSVDAGKTWQWMTVKDHEKRDFRDIEAFDKNRAVIMAVAEPAVILKTTDGGLTWKEVYRNETTGMFLDAMEFWNEQSGIVIGDPIDGKFFIARTFDGGETWDQLPENNLPLADSGEACFAASGTNIRALDLDEACFITGGRVSRFFYKGSPVTLPIIQGKETTGANSVAIKDWKKRKGGQQIFIVGGDFARDTCSTQNSVYSTNGGKSWQTPAVPPVGYKSCVEFFGKTRVITCGTTGVEVSGDDGKTWKNISHTGFHVTRKAKKGKAVFLAGGNGRIARLDWE